MGFSLNELVGQFKVLINDLNAQLQDANANCSANQGGTESGGGTGSGGNNQATTSTAELGTTNNPYEVNQDIYYEQTQLVDLENELTKEKLDDMEKRAKSQNKELEKAYSTKFSKSQYQTEKISAINYYIYYLIWIYACIAVVFIGFLFVGPKSKKTSFYFKLAILLLLIAYPYYITPLQDYIYHFIRFCLDTLHGNVFFYSDY